MKSLWTLALCALASIGFAAETARVFDPNTVVGRVDNGAYFLQKMATAWCLDEGCSLIVTNYHSVPIVGSHMVFHGVRVTEKLVATGPQDDGAIMLDHLSGARLQYNPARDLAILKLEAPLREAGMRNVEFRAAPLKEGDKATVYACPKGKCLKEVQLEFMEEMSNGLLLFNFANASDLAQGASGGLIVDKDNRAVGVLRSLQGKLAIAVPSRTLLEFVKKVQPEVYARVAPKIVETQEVAEALPDGLSISPELSDELLSYQDAFIPPPPQRKGEIKLKSRSEQEPQAIRELRQKAQQMVEQMGNFAAVQSVLIAGEEEKYTEHWKHLVKVTDGRQTFRQLPDGKKELKELPFPEHGGIAPGGEWSSLPEMVGNDLKLYVEPAEDLVLGGRRLKVFRFHGNEETKACSLRLSAKTFFGEKVWRPPVSCTGEVWTDDDLNILRISQAQRVGLGKGKVAYGKTVVHYGRLKDAHVTALLLPARIHIWFDWGEHWTCNGEFSHYQLLSQADGTSTLPQKSRRMGKGTVLLAEEQPMDAAFDAPEVKPGTKPQ